MQCFNKTDFEYRCRFLGGDVIHAVRDTGSNTYPFGYKRLLTGCGLNVQQHQLIKGHLPEVTCKVCIKAMKFEEKEPSNIRFLVEDTAAGLYFKRLAGYQTDWVEDAWNATLWKTYDGAEGKLKEIIAARFYSIHGPVRHKKPMLWTAFFNRQMRNLAIRKIKLEALFID